MLRTKSVVILGNADVGECPCDCRRPEQSALDQPREDLRLKRTGYGVISPECANMYTVETRIDETRAGVSLLVEPGHPARLFERHTTESGAVCHPDQRHSRQFSVCHCQRS